MPRRARTFIIYALALLVFAQSAFAGDPAVSPEQARTMIMENQQLFILDVRTPEEYAGPHYNNSTNIPVDLLESRASEIPADRTVLVHCAKGGRAQRAYGILQQNRPDIKNLYYLQGVPLYP